MHTVICNSVSSYLLSIFLKEATLMSHNLEGSEKNQVEDSKAVAVVVIWKYKQDEALLESSI